MDSLPCSKLFWCTKHQYVSEKENESAVFTQGLNQQVMEGWLRWKLWITEIYTAVVLTMVQTVNIYEVELGTLRSSLSQRFRVRWKKDWSYIKLLHEPRTAFCVTQQKAQIISTFGKFCMLLFLKITHKWTNMKFDKYFIFLIVSIDFFISSRLLF